jgi:uncharacterized protein (TIGR03118 family)
MRSLSNSFFLIAPFLALQAGGSSAASSEGDDGLYQAPPSYQATPLVSDTGLDGTKKDANLVNGWGIAFNPTGASWVSDNGSGKSTLYLGNGAPVPLVVTVPAGVASGSVAGSPTGIIYNDSTEFVVTETVPAKGGGTTTLSGAASFVFATEDGVIAGWAPSVDVLNARIAVDNSTKGAVYKGLAIAGTGTTFQLYATDFRNRRIDVFDAEFKPVKEKAGAFEDPHLPADYAPFGIQNINGDLYVTYAKQDAARHDDVPGAGAGYVEVYDTSGKLIRCFAERGALDAPWGLALAPTSFGRFGGALLVGNFGNGIINAYDPLTGRHLGTLDDKEGKAIVLKGLWGIAFGNGVDAQPADALFYAAGPGDETHGGYGVLKSVPVE